MHHQAPDAHSPVLAAVRPMRYAVALSWLILVVSSQSLAGGLFSSGRRQQLHDLVRAVYRLLDAAPAPDGEFLPVELLVYVRYLSSAQVFAESPSRPRLRVSITTRGNKRYQDIVVLTCSFFLSAAMRAFGFELAAFRKLLLDAAVWIDAVLVFLLKPGRLFEGGGRDS